MIEDGRVQSAESPALPTFFALRGYLRQHGGALHRKAQGGGQALDAALAPLGKSYAEIGLYYSEAAHARQFSEKYGAMLMESFGVLANVPQNVRARERQLRQELGRASARGLVSIAAAPVDARQESENAARAYRDFVDSARRQFPRYGAIAFPRPIAPAELPGARRNTSSLYGDGGRGLLIDDIEPEDRGVRAFRYFGAA